MQLREDLFEAFLSLVGEFGAVLYRAKNALRTLRGLANTVEMSAIHSGLFSSAAPVTSNRSVNGLKAIRIRSRR